MDPQQILSRLKSATESFTTTQLATLALTFVLVVSVIAGSAWYLNKPTYTLLFADMDAETAGQIITKLKTMKIPYELDPGGKAIRVPSDRVDELRIDLTAAGLPQTGRVGFEIFDRTAFGATEFLEQVNYRRALEGEIARTIGTITEVSSARVHIAMGKETLFGESKPAKASVVLKLRGSKALTNSTISGISNLVASSVDGLRPEAVVILDSFGRPLARPEGSDDDPLGAARTERQQRLEREMAARVVALLEPVVGEERVRVNVALKLNASTREESEERFDPNSVVRSKQNSTDLAQSASAVPMVAGARGNAVPSPNDPIKPAPAGGSTGQTSSRSNETTNYEISRLTRHTIQPPGDVARVSVAVILDDEPVMTKGKDGVTKITRQPRKREELQKIQGLVAAAVGLETDRGDQLTVENVSFEEPLVEEPPTPTLLQRYSPQIWEGGRILGVLALGMFGLMLFVRPLMRRSGVEPMAARPALAMAAGVAAATALPVMGPGGTPIKTVAELESEIESQLDASTAPTAEQRRLPVLTKRVAALSAQQPESVAKLLRHWISESER